ncbi:MAG: quinone-dependent dihydroorotate dehydrogenase [Flavobacteriaceae bacterium]|nr:quinone-dependent dihydroorotate dehydrogenase [Flavobacteriaceae bacterium]
MYKKIILPFLFLFDPEKVHNFTFLFFKISLNLPFIGFFIEKTYSLKNKKLEKKLFGLDFKNPVGLAAGFDKNAKLYKELSRFGFGFIEIGTVTPEPQQGNQKKRLFRLNNDQGIINRMGFNNDGMIKIALRLKKNKNILIGGNIGKNKNTSNPNAVNDYLLCFNHLYDFVDYFVVNVSSPNTPNLRELQNKDFLSRILKSLKDENLKKTKPKPILLKISPDLSYEILSEIVDLVISLKIDGIIATNTTVSRDNLISKHKNEPGGLSGRPVAKKSNEVIRYINKKSNGLIPIIGVGGIHSAQDAIDKIKAGADLVQIYTGFIYEGPSLIKSINKALVDLN